MFDSSEIQRRLGAYLSAPAEQLRVLASGWETTILEFRLAAESQSIPSLPIAEPIVVRFYQGSAADAKGAREFTTIDRLSRAGYSVPTPYAFEPDREVLGAPFMIMQRLAGGPLFAIKSFPQAFKTFSLGFFAFVRAQARLHRLDPGSVGLRDIPHAFAPHHATESPAAEVPLLDRMLAIIVERVEEGPLPGLRDALRTVTERAHVFRASKPTLVHMDYHPQNVMVKNTRVTGVIDWVNTDVGDRHLDAATTAVILATSAMEHPRWMRDNIVGNGLRANFAAMYLPLYHAMAPLELQRFRYCQAVAALMRLSMLGMMATRGPESVGFRAEAIREVTPGVVRLLSRYASRKTAVAVRLDFPH
ncbi:MAG: phosphotransferase [Candidatus Binatus sp.]|uniref:phosphotransferase n=1 Tax=Candidatus Binatus sp. TaxID=2811406 RepID=UPI00271E68C3|nr:phosphotransferase [Candidatus Binatus sp.]MDO8434526.1 phosphotransferase [Candidatus Binatus sp.]